MITVYIIATLLWVMLTVLWIMSNIYLGTAVFGMGRLLFGLQHDENVHVSHVVRVYPDDPDLNV